ncbi:MAG: VWA domain-containing protein [Solirubrobacterales bacterium]|nr:VWA domain-containing protein [Solirubrobacterales bacterium]
MSFREPTVLLGLALLPVAVLAYLAVQQRRRREAASFGNPVLLPGLMTARPGWRRHLPGALLLLAVAAMILALARPQRSVAAPQRAATVVLVNDVSGSMRSDDVSPSRLTAAINSAKVLVDKTPDNFRLGLVTFADYAEQLVAPTTDHGAVESALERMVADGGTAMGDGLARGLQTAQTPVPTEDGKGTRKLPAIIVLLSDGKNTLGVNSPLEVAEKARQARVPIYAIALGTERGEVVQRDPFGFTQHIPVPPDKETLREIATITGGRSFEAVSADDAEEIYAKIGTRLTSRPEQREITVAFAGGAFVLLVVGGALSLVWFGRLP